MTSLPKRNDDIAVVEAFPLPPFLLGMEVHHEKSGKIYPAMRVSIRQAVRAESKAWSV